jgi:hypothetical protein
LESFMTATSESSAYPFHTAAVDHRLTTESTTTSAVSWGAIFAGATAAAAISLILLSLGTGLGLSSISPWAQSGVHAKTFGVSSIVWVIVTQLCASALGGYLAGRLRSRWTALHTDEVHFRDTAHGLLTWALASLLTAALILGAASSFLGAATKASTELAASAVAGTAAVSKVGSGESGADGNGPMAYLVDSLFRKDTSVASNTTNGTDIANSDSARLPLAEVTRIFIHSSGAEATTLPPSDVRYLGQLVTQRTGLQPSDAERRVNETYATLQKGINNAKTAAAEAADKARKVGIQVSLWLFIAFLSGAFIASLTATLGGRERDL